MLQFGYWVFICSNMKGSQGTVLFTVLHKRSLFLLSNTALILLSIIIWDMKIQKKRVSTVICTKRVGGLKSLGLIQYFFKMVTKSTLAHLIIFITILSINIILNYLHMSCSLVSENMSSETVIVSNPF